MSTEITKSEPCLTMDFKVNQYSFEVEVAVIENVSAKPITISQLFGQTVGSNQLRRRGIVAEHDGQAGAAGRARDARAIVTADRAAAARLRCRGSNHGQYEGRRQPSRGAQAGAGELQEDHGAPAGDACSGPRSTRRCAATRAARRTDTYVIRKVRESFKPPSYPTRSDFAFGPEWALSGLALGGETMAFDATPPNVILITASSEAGSCPILYIWDARRGDLDPPRQGAPRGADARPRSERDRAI